MASVTTPRCDVQIALNIDATRHRIIADNVHSVNRSRNGRVFQSPFQFESFELIKKLHYAIAKCIITARR